MEACYSHLSIRPVGRRERMTIRYMKQRAVIAAALLIMLAVGLSTGCGGGNGSALLQGNAAHRAAIIAGYQSFSAGVAYPFTSLKLVAPAGGTLSQSKAADPLARSLFRPLLPPLSRQASITRSPGLAYSSALSLYADSSPVVSGNQWTLNFYSDSAGTQRAGAITITLPASANGTNNYPTFPALINIAINLQAGNIPCTGNVQINFLGGS